MIRNINNISHHNIKSIFITLLPEKYHFKYQLTKIKGYNIILVDFF